jgi:CRISPR-associated protein Cmr3
MPNYQLKLTPIDTFFFGNEKHIDTADNGDAIANYFVESNLYPQQTTILGALRFFILKEAGSAVFNNNRIVDKSKAEKLIGPQSFDFELENQSFGEIESISAVYFLKDNTPYFFGPLDFESNMTADFSFSKEIEGKTTLYSSKNHEQFVNHYIVNKNGERFILSDIVKSQTKVGNKKNSTEEAFYKQNSKYLMPGWSFAVNVSTKTSLKTLSAFLTLGGEKTIFKADFEPINDFQTLKEMPKHYRPVPCIFCLSDCLLSPTDFSKVAFGITQSVSFRNLHSVVMETNSYSALTTLKGKGKLRKGDRFNLLMRGSVLYFSDNDALEEVSSSLIRNSNAFKIGFNQFISKK